RRSRSSSVASWRTPGISSSGGFPPCWSDALMASGSPRRRSVVVTGAFGNLGMAVARSFREQGALVALLDHTQAPARVAAEFPAPHCVLGSVDLTQAASAGTAMETVRQTLGSIDVLVNIAGGFRWQTVEQGDIE